MKFDPILLMGPKFILGGFNYSDEKIHNEKTSFRKNIKTEIFSTKKALQFSGFLNDIN